VKPSATRVAIIAHFSSCGSSIEPSETSTWASPSARSHGASSPKRSCMTAISVTVPPSTTGTPCAT
jgi:hypothetical protein